jgi:hypothetical protein
VAFVSVSSLEAYATPARSQRGYAITCMAGVAQPLTKTPLRMLAHADAHWPYVSRKGQRELQNVARRLVAIDSQLPTSASPIEKIRYVN